MKDAQDGQVVEQAASAANLPRPSLLQRIPSPGLAALELSSARGNQGFLGGLAQGRHNRRMSAIKHEVEERAAKIVGGLYVASIGADAVHTTLDRMEQRGLASRDRAATGFFQDLHEKVTCDMALGVAERTPSTVLEAVEHVSNS